MLLGGVITVILGGQIRAIEAIYRQALHEREASEERERVARREAEGANQAKDQFLATVSHELRTPLTAILGWSRLLRSDRSDADRQRRAIEAIERNSVAQAQLIDDLLDVSRIVSGKLRLDLQEMDLHKVIAAATDSVRPALDARQIRFQTHDRSRRRTDARATRTGCSRWCGTCCRTPSSSRPRAARSSWRFSASTRTSS